MQRCQRQVAAHGPRLAKPLPWAMLAWLLISGAGCGGGLFGRAGVAALEAEVTARDGSLTVTRVRGPARFRWLGPARFVMAARFLRPDPGGHRRGDLSLEVLLPVSPDATGRFFGSPQALTATYSEAALGQPAGPALEGHGSVRLEMFFGSGVPSVRAAVELEFRTDPAAGPVETTRLSGVIVTGEDEETGQVSLIDLGVGLWSDVFDPYLALDSPDLDYIDTVTDSSYDEFVWATEPSAGGGDYGGFSYDPYSYEGDYGFPGDGFDYGEYDGFDPGEGEVATVSDCGGGEYQDDGSEGYACSDSGDDASADCGGSSSEGGSGCESSGGEAPDCQGAGDECATMTRGPPRTLLVLLVVLLAWRWRWRRRRRAGEHRGQPG